MMNEQVARGLIQVYIDGWKQNSLSQIISPLSKDCLIVESHGSTYRGMDEVKHWVASWIEAHSKVLYWDLRSFYFSENAKTAFCEWDFACMINHKDCVLAGASVIRFSGDQIITIHEYRMTDRLFL